MRILNGSKHKTSSLKHLVAFAASTVRMSHMARLSLLDREAGLASGGEAEKRYGASKAEPSMITLWLSRGLKYPFGQTHVQSVGQIVFRSWEEEILFVLSHELRHIDQMWGAAPSGTYDENEEDAELHALQVLRQWRAVSWPALEAQH